MEHKGEVGTSASGSFPVQSPKNPPAGADCALWRERFPRSAPPAARIAWRCGAEFKPLGVGEVLGEVLGVQGGYLKPRAGVLSLLASAAAQRQRQPDDPDDPDENESMLSAGARISEIYACYGIRCARLRGIRLHVCELRLGPAQQ